MLTVTVPSQELFNEATQKFIRTSEATLQLEHSLLSVSKWEQTWHKPFLSGKSLSIEEQLDYIRCMTINKDVDPNVYLYLPNSVLTQIAEYIDNPMSAITFNTTGNGHHRERIYSETIYFWMISFGIPFECQKWHLNRLLSLIKLCNDKNTPPKQMSEREALANMNRINEEQKKKFNTKG